MHSTWQIPDDASSIIVNDYPLTYREKGGGAPLVLLHGSLNDYRSWVNQLGAFAARYHVFALSLRHYFPEKWDGTGGAFSLAQHAADVAAFVTALGLPKVHLLGHSRGGAVAYLVARDHPQIVRSLVLAEPRGLEGLLPGEAEAARDDATASIFAALHEALAAGRTVEAASAFVDSFNGAGSWDAMPELQKRIILDNIGTAVDSGELPDMTCADAAGLALPVLLVRGEKSLERYRRGMQAMRRCNPAIPEVVTIPGAPHGMHRANPEAFNAAVLAFLDGVS
jgi:pimeloyl-ACP methyl ester carboxylesterase